MANNTDRQLYDAWLFWCPTERCDLNCVYCFTPGYKKRAATLTPINIPMMAKTLNETGRVFKIHFSGGGEPLLVPNIVEACVELSKKHYLTFNTNLLSDASRHIAQRVDPGRIVKMVATAHIEQIQRRGLLDRFIENYIFCRERKINIVAHIIGYPPILRDGAKYTDLFKRRGVDVSFAAFIGSYEGKTYPNAYTNMEILELVSMGLNKQCFNISLRGQILCNAGYNTGIIYPDGTIRSCGAIAGSIGNIYKGLKFNKYMVVCPKKRCLCPLNSIDRFIFEKALAENSGVARRLAPFFIRYLSRLLPLFAPRQLRD
ncbi:MAG: radical SAM protein [Candidatus Omnitrophica bacterium]|nr:radical SAM protein [Candidatus Omnitrophota bacterium]